MSVALASSSKVSVTLNAPDPVLLVPKPSGLAVGDLLLVEIWSWCAANNFGTDTIPSGWSTSLSDDNGAGIKGILYWKIATSTETAASTFSFTRGTAATNAFSAIGLCARITGAHPTAPLAVTPTVNRTANASSSLTWPAITTTSRDNLIVYMQASYINTGATNGTSWPTQGPAGTTVDSGATLNNGTLIAGIAWVNQAAIATVASTSKTINNTNNGQTPCFTVAVVPAPITPFHRDLTYLEM